MISPLLYQSIFLYAVIIMTLIVASKLSNQSYQSIRKGNNNISSAAIIWIVFALWIGFRPMHPIFGDSVFYSHTYHLMQQHLLNNIGEGSDWLWELFGSLCSQIMDVSFYFTIVAIGYFGFTLLSCKILVNNNVLAGYLFMLGSISCFSYATNGIRNGFACSLVLVAISIVALSKKNLVITILLALIASNIHKSTLLPIACLFASLYFVKSFKWAYTFWILSIIISLVAGGFVTSIFAGLGFDDRLTYLTSEGDGQYTKTYFRWDFLVYSMMPIILGYYVVIKRGVQDRAYLILLNTYTLANAFWVMIIRANYSNRFAYLSWFMYPLVLAYPLFKLDIWGQYQGKNASKIMLAHVGFTWIMQVIYW